MHLKTTFFLLLALALAVGVIWMMDWDGETSEEVPAVEKKLLPVEPEKIVYVSFYREGEFIECVNDHGQWTMTKPVAARADAARIHRILAAIEMLPRGETITAAQRQTRGLTPNDYGLAKPRARIVLGGTDKRSLLSIGNESPLKNAVYVQVDREEDIVATSGNLLEVLPRQAADIRDRFLLAGAADYVRRLEIKRASGPLVQLAKEGSEWVVNKPVLARADWAKVSALLDQLFSLSVHRFVSDTMGDPAAYGLSEDESALQLGVWQADDKTVDRLLFGKKADEQGETVYVARRESGSLMTVKRDRLDSLLAAATDLRDPRLYFMAPEKMSLIRIEEGERALEFHKIGDAAWQIVKPQQGKADARMVADLIVQLNTLRADQVPAGASEAALGLERPARVIRVAEGYAAPGPTNQGTAAAVAAEGRGEQQSRTLLIGPPQPGREYVFARFEGEPFIYRVSASSSSTISLDPLSYRDGTVLALEPSAIRRIALKRQGAEQAVERVGADDWKPLTPAGGEVSRGALTNLLARAADLKALRFERSDIRDLAVYGLKDARASLTFSLSGAEGIQKTLLFGENSEDLGVYAMFQGQDLVFVLEKTLADALTRELVQ